MHAGICKDLAKFLYLGYIFDNICDNITIQYSKTFEITNMRII